MQPNKFLFFLIVGLAVLIVAGMFGAAYFFLNEPLELPAIQEETTIQVIVAPSIQPWAEQAARVFNRDNPNTPVQIVSADSLIPENQFKLDTPQAVLPAAWLAESTFVVEMAADRGLQFDEERVSVAGSSLAWGAYADKQEAFVEAYGDFSWDNLHAKAVSPTDFLTLVIASPHNRAEGLAALISAAAAHLGQDSLTNADVSQATPWLTEIFKDNTRIPPKPAEAFATAQGRSLGDAGILSQAAWQSAGLEDRADFTLMPVQPDVRLDYPFAIWSGSQATPEGRQAATNFRDFLLSEAQQQALPQFGFEPAGGSTPTVQIDGQAAWALSRWAERELE
jgi:ABC-type molybdate transport system substrate-binding protein